MLDTNKMCKAKKSYEDKKTALTAKNWREKHDHDIKPGSLRIYNCPICKKWHMTSKV